MDTTFAVMACCLLACPFAVAQKDKDISVLSTPLNLTGTATVTPPNSTANVTIIANLTENTTPLANTTQNNATTSATVAATTESTSESHPQTVQSTITTPQTSQMPQTTATGTNTPTLTTLLTLAQETTGSHITSPATTVTTAVSSNTVNTTSESMHRTTQSSGLRGSEMNLTIIFSVILGVFVMAPVVFMFHKCKHKFQYLHQPLTNITESDTFGADDDTLVISGGLYDGHPIYDNVPTVSEDQSQFRLEFLH
ncbi:sialomucin core protein 24-like [Cheilinus undulatus]|uniref:sialomucin core protein 24-like n=1 Tax=Cheilinus undulatus TaxID=241271 RepID=UPI001BD3FCB5|nr:sialomucin core protein 24-like [Cheilinus undulatus]XP_041636553.1 sialomucin core protein 24-like [Cheilinus undulatus]XP_041636561.1 sialomucin core protein 24-like [Cheilinus undulatus]